MDENGLSSRQCDALIERFVGRDIAGVNALLRLWLAWPVTVTIEVVDNARAAEAVPIWRYDPPDRCRFRFHAKTWQRHPAEIFGRWLDLLPLIAAVSAEPPHGRCLLNLGDEGHRPGLAFDTSTRDHVLIPDYSFIKTRGYADLARSFATRAIVWGDRRPVVFWRGSTTGYAADIAALPRVRLCRAAMALGGSADIGLVAAVQHFVGMDDWLRDQGIMRDFVPPTAYDDYQLHVDIDGNSSSWGLLAKLHSGGAILKVTSPDDHRQWYHGALEPWDNYVPVRADLSDLAQIVAMLLADPRRAEAIGCAGQRLARSLGYAAEIARAVPIIKQAFS